MKFRNYRNSFNNSNRIYSEDDIRNMTLQTLFDKEDDVLAQNRAIGVPTTEELNQSSNVIWIESYTKDDGTEVKGHWRSLPDGEYTGAASDITQNKNEKSLSQVEIEQQDERLYPKEIAGVKRGKPKSFEEARGEDINPDYYSGNPEDHNNCQSCVVAFEARRRGYDVQAAKQTEQGKIWELARGAYGPYGAWLDNETKEPCEGIVIEEKSGKECFDLLDKEIKQGERYAFSYSYSIDFIYSERLEGHIVIIDRNDEGKLRFYDPQNDTMREDYEIIDKFNAIVDFSGNNPRPRMLRIDNKEFNPYYIHEVVRKHY